MIDITGKTILYTGGAGGLGLETTMHFLDAGARVVVIDRDSRQDGGAGRGGQGASRRAAAGARFSTSPISRA